MNPRDPAAPETDGRPSAGVWLRAGEHDLALAAGESVLGRSPACEVVVDDPMVSRRHARIVVHHGTVTIEDLGSVNGVLVNGERLARARVLVSGDRILIGQQSFLLLAEGPAAGTVVRAARAGTQTLTAEVLSRAAPRPVPSLRGDGAPRSEPERTEATRKGQALELLGVVADKMLALGRGDEAERILGGYLRNLAQAIRVGGTAEGETLERASAYALRIAEATGRGIWVDYVFELFTLARRLPSAPLVERLYEAVRRAQPISATVFRQYLGALRGLEPAMGPAERFLLRRLEGLESAAVLR